MLGLVPIHNLSSTGSETPVLIRSPLVPAYTEHPEVNITDDSEFSLQGFTGNGILGDPYVLEGVNITGEGMDVTGILINIQDTTAYVEIRDSYFSSANLSSTAIKLQNAPHVTVKGCIFSNVLAALAYSSNYFTFTNNKINSTSSGAVRLWLSPFANISGNTVDGSISQKYFHLEYSDESSANNNTIYNGYIRFERSNSSSISGNTISGGHIIVDSCEHLLINKNELSDRTGNAAIRIWTSSYCNITSNSAVNFHYTDGTFRVFGSTNLLIRDNIATMTEFTTSGKYGFNVEYSSDCVLTNNSASSFIVSGFRFANSNDLFVDNSSAYDNLYGFVGTYSDGLKLNNCITYDNEYGFHLEHSDNLWIYYCKAENNTKTGYEIIECNDADIFYSQAFRNKHHGFLVSSGSGSEHTYFWDCQAHFNSRNGFFIEVSPYAEIWASQASYNGYSGFSIDTSEHCRIGLCHAHFNGDHGYEFDSSLHCILSTCKASYSHDSGFYLRYSENTTLIECESTNNGLDGIQTRSSSEIAVNNSVCMDNDRYGIHIWGCASVILDDNKVNGSRYEDVRLESSVTCTLKANSLGIEGLYIKGNSLDQWTHTISEDNLVDSRSIKYYFGESDKTFNLTTYGQVFLVDCENIQTHGGIFKNSTTGIVIAYSLNCSIHDVITNDCDTGISILESDTCSVVSGEFHGSGLYKQVGISSTNSPRTNVTSSFFDDLFEALAVDSCPDSLFQWNTISDMAGGGLDISYSPDSIVSHNVFTSVDQGTIYVSNSDRMMIDNNTLSQNLSSGICLVQSNYVTIEDNSIAGEGLGIQLFNLIGTQIENNTVIADYATIQFSNARDTEIFDNVMSGSGLLFESEALPNWNHTIDGNLFDGLPLGYFKNLNNTVLNASDFGQLIFISCENITVRGTEHDGVSVPLYLVTCTNVNVSDYRITNAVSGMKILYSQQCNIDNYSVKAITNQGFYVYESDTILFSNCRVNLTGEYGFHLYNTVNSNISNSQVHNSNSFGIYLQYADATEINKLLAVNCSSGLHVYSSDDCLVTNSGFFNNINGVRISGPSANNTFYQNDFADNIDYNAWDDTTDIVGSQWDNGIDTGNSWSDYLGGENYTVYGSGGGVDNYPRLYPGHSILISSPIDQTIFEGAINKSITWTCTSGYIESWIIYVNSSYNSGGRWTNDSIRIDLYGLSIGHYFYTLALLSYFGESASDSVDITVLEATAPIIIAQDDVVSWEGTGESINWEVIHSYPEWYSIYVNGTVDISEPWTGSNIIYFLEGFSVGYYNVTLAVSSQSGNVATDTVWVNILEDIAPIIIPQDDIMLWEGSSGHLITWKVTHPFPGGYGILVNGTLDISGPWNGSDITYLLEGLSAGLYNITLGVGSQSWKIATDTVWVTVRTMSVPQIDNPSDLEFEEGSTGRSITWTVSDLYPERFEILVNGVLNRTGAWNGSNIVFILDGCPVGEYNITLTVYSESGLSSSDSVLVTVLPSTTSTTTATTTTTTPPGTTTGTTTITTSTGTTNPSDLGPMYLIILVIVSVGAVILVLFIGMKKMR